MSVLNQSGDEQVECPLCMEPLEVDDLNFFPCTCGYQICRFCWHRIRTDENGLCPACRKAYSENPADFTPLSKEQVAQLKAEKRQRDQQRKAKISESRKHLANVRVVQKNLVFVVGLPMRLADAEVLKRHEYFGKFGKIHKVVINQSTTYAGPQGPSASAYVTYMKSDDALRAIQSVNNITIDGRPIKSSLGTTKYCSHFMKNQPCPKPDCMYLHDFDPEASFTKEQMHTGKHQEYEKKLHENLLTKMQLQLQQQQQCGGAVPASSTAETKTTNSKSKDSSSGSGGNLAGGGGGKDKDGWPTLSTDKKEGGKEKGTAVTQKGKKKKEATLSEGKKTEKGKSVVKCSFSGTSGQTTNQTTDNTTTTKSDKNTTAFSNIWGLTGKSVFYDIRSVKPAWYLNNNTCSNDTPIMSYRECVLGTEDSKQTQSSSKSKSEEISSNSSGSGSEKSSYSSLTKLPIVNDDSSFFSHNAFQKLPDGHRSHHDDDSSLLSESPDDHAHVLNDSMPNITSSEDWEAAFGFTKHNTTTTSHQDELAKRRASGVKDTLETFGGGFASSPLASQPSPDLFETMQRSSFNSTVPNGGKLPSDGILEALVNKQFAQNGVFPTNKMAAAPSSDRPYGLTSGHVGSINGLNGLNSLVGSLNGLDQQMSKFFVDFYKNGQSKSDMFGSGSSGVLNGLSNLNGLAQQNEIKSVEGFLHNIADRQNLLYLQQKQIEEQLRSLNLAKQTFTAQRLLHNGLHNQFVGSANGTEQQAGFAALGQHKQAAEDELDFDPFHETQKGLAELMEDEQNHKLLNAGRTSHQPQMNGLGHSQSATNNSLPPPPPGFMQSTTHMNSFGSKILPYLNMNNSNQPQVNSTQNSWSPAAGYSQIQQQQQNQQLNKGIGSCNNELKDWKVLDPAIVTSSRHYQPVTSLHLRDRSLQQQHIEQRSPPLSSTSNPYGYNWVGSSELATTISRPPGFRPTPNQTGKQQEC